MAGPHTLYLIRHGIAEERGEAWPDDTKRPLTAEGMTRLRKQARGLARLGIAFDVVLTSPFVRTRQTAEIIASAFDPRPHLATSDALTPEGTYAALLEDLAKHARRTHLALVGHEPGIGELAARLIGSRHPIPFKRGAVCCIDVDTQPPSGPGALRWFLSPKLLRSLKR
ncbi:MAG TPA: phosphohistidine phosphatase SixA [Vicinamibacterales bacterium]|nr:phosphohistidine phosphatase SixA [Vicinamibacterales bacterium]